MSYYAVFDDDTGGDVATNKGWADFCDFVLTRPKARHMNMLVKTGQCDSLNLLAMELDTYFDEAGTSEELLDLLKQHPDANTITITDGLD